MRTLAVILLSTAALAQNSSAPTPPVQDNARATEVAHAAPDLASQVPAPRPQDVKSMNAILAAIYDVISGPPGDRDWNRFRSLFVPQARFTALNKNPDGSVAVTLISVDEFVQLGGELFKKEGFYEHAIVNRAQTYGNIAQVFSSYESRRARGEKAFERGINSIQLLNDGKRWWVLSILWDVERPDNPLPAAMTKAVK